MKNIVIDTSFITMQRPRYRFRYKAAAAAAAAGITNSTPPGGTTFVSDRPLMAARRRDNEEGSLKEMDQEGFSTTEGRSPGASSAPSTCATSTPCGKVVWTKVEANRAQGNDDTDEDDDEDMTFGLHGMTMGTSGSDVDMDS